MTEVVGRKKKKLNNALADAIGVGNASADDIEEKIHLAMISEKEDAQKVLSKLNPSFRQKEIFEITLKICREKGEEVEVHDVFIDIFSKYFPILGVDSARSSWKQIVECLPDATSRNAAVIAAEFIKSANLLSTGFRLLVNDIKDTLPPVIQQYWKDKRYNEAVFLCYTLISLLLAEKIYSDDDAEDPYTFWATQVVNDSMRNHFEIALLSMLAQSQKPLSAYDLSMKVVKPLEEFKIFQENHELIFSIFLNHFEYAYLFLAEPSSRFLFQGIVAKYTRENKLKQLYPRLQTTEIEISGALQPAIALVLNEILEEAKIQKLTDLSSCQAPEDVAKLLASAENRPSLDFINVQVEQISEFMTEVQEIFENDLHSARHLFHMLELRKTFESSEEIRKNCEKMIIGLIENSKYNIVDEFCLESENLEFVRDVMEVSKIYAEEQLREKYVSRTADQVTEGLEALESSDCAGVLDILKEVYLNETKMEIFDAVMMFVAGMDGGRNLLEIEVYIKLLEIYGGTRQESMCVQVIFAKLAAHNWITKETLENFAGNQNSDVWFEILAVLIELMDKMIKNAKNTIVKSFTATYTQVFTNLLKNIQKYVNRSVNIVKSETIDEEELKLRILRRHKVCQDVARIVDSMKRHESYFSMITAAIISDTVFFGNMTLLAMAKLHGLADKNAQALLATNLPVIDRTRYAKFLPLINNAARRLY